jgi:short-subunit dehydrogenase
VRNAIVVGASSGIGRELAAVLSENGYAVGLTGRRLDLLEEVKAGLSTPAFTKQMDVSDPVRAMEQLEELIEEMGGLDLIVISAGTGFLNRDLRWEWEEETVCVNVLGFVALANVAFRHFEKAGGGHLAGISSLAALRGNRIAPAYNASKAFISNYMEGLRFRAAAAGLPIVVTDIRPGFVDTAMAKGPGLFWVASPRKAALQIMDAIRRRKKRVYVTRRWVLIAMLMKILPDSFLTRR